MKLKYYMRGLGTGILFAIIVMSLTGANGKETMSDSEIIHAAKKLGMVEADSNVKITGLNPTPTPEASTQEPEDSSTITPITEPTEIPESIVTEEPTQEPTEEPTQEPIQEPTLAPTATPTPTPDPTPTPSPEPTKAPEEVQGNESIGETITLTIVKGMYSHHVADEAKRIGLVEDAKEFDRYLIDNGYASSIRIGDYVFEQGVTFAEIAEIITRRP